MTSDADNYAPVATECEARDLPVLGELPRELNGTLFRNGPNPQFPLGHHWFLGDGMIHAFTLRDGRAAYRNRWVRTPKFLAEREAGRPLGGALFREGGVANTNILAHAGRLLALEEAHAPIEVDPATLRTLGPRPLGGAGPVTAHPKIDPETGEMWFFGYSAGGPLSRAIRFGAVDRAGAVTGLGRFDAPYCSMVHDFILTECHAVFPIMPLAGSLRRALRGGLPFAWQPELGGHVGVMRRDGGAASLRWFHAETGYVFHVMNAWEEDGRILADVMRYEEPPLFPRADGKPTDPARATPYLCRWTIDPDGGTDAFTSQTLDDLSGEFPRVDDRRAGRSYRHGWFVGSREDAFDTLAHLDHVTGTRTLLELPPGDATSEPVFVPRAPDAAEGDGWVLAVIWRGAERRSELLVLRADAIQDRPVATVRLPQRVPFGFHGNWEAV
jgi:carotenoid cleavage dioxygenase-like enzyme